ncbi:uncharacterized protein [Argopecten irradians]|uniref:uncharacterized protein n=1 Tax=Argopecten irradians TaxID=31199 RepID=UPI003717F85D
MSLLMMYSVLLICVLQVVIVYSQGRVRLQYTYPKREGPIEIFYYRTQAWNTICGNCWTNEDANVACRELGYSGGVRKVSDIKGSGIVAVRFNCPSGNEANLSSCQFSESACNPCTNTAGVLCTGAVRLSDVPSSIKSVEVFDRDNLGSYIYMYICGDCWTQSNADVTCKGLGYKGGAANTIRRNQGNHLFSIGQYQCDGTEFDLGSCRWSNTACSQCGNFAAVECVDDKTLPVDGGWSRWSDFGPCSVTCGQGHQIRIRTCDNPSPGNGGKACKGGDQDGRACTNVECPINGGWSTWSDFGPCSVTCGPGHRTKTRTCNNPTPQYEGLDCHGDDLDEKACNENECPIDGGWSEWIDFGPCSVTCGQGYRIRTRTCDNPSPQHGGRDCDGEGRDVQLCSTEGCPKTWNETCSTDSQCAGNLVCKDNTTCYCRHETDVWDPTNLRCQSSSDFLAIFSQEEMDFDTATEFCTTNLTGFLATPNYINNMFITCMDTDHVIWLAESMATTNIIDEDSGMCVTGQVDQTSQLLVMEVSCTESRRFVCVVNQTNKSPFSDDPACYGFSTAVLTTVKTVIPLGIIIAIVAACVVLLVAAIVFVLIKRRRLTKSGSHSEERSDPLPVSYNIDAAKVAVKVEPDMDIDHYSECTTGGPSEDTNHYSEGTAGPSTDTDNYGYGLLGKTGSRSVRMGEEDMYSHTKPGQPLDDGYDVFVKRKDTVDESGIYDHAGNCMIEGEYDSFQDQKHSVVENDYSQYSEHR